MKTWTDLLGPFNPTCVIHGQYLSIPTGGGTFRTIYRADDAVMAKRIYELWKVGY